jgi:hypothetical protein
MKHCNQLKNSDLRAHGSRQQRDHFRENQTIDHASRHGRRIYAKGGWNRAITFASKVSYAWAHLRFAPLDIS